MAEELNITGNEKTSEKQQNKSKVPEFTKRQVLHTDACFVSASAARKPLQNPTKHRLAQGVLLYHA
ncbi:MAG: hypothetical protein ACQES0_08315 [Bacteroidota bacterium]